MNVITYPQIYKLQKCLFLKHLERIFKNKNIYFICTALQFAFFDIEFYIIDPPSGSYLENSFFLIYTILLYEGIM